MSIFIHTDSNCRTIRMDLTECLLTLPSNVNDAAFPNNNNHFYETTLSEPLEISARTHEIGLREIQYTTSWNNIVKGVVTYKLTNAEGQHSTFEATVRDGRYLTCKDVLQEIFRSKKDAVVQISGSTERIRLRSAVVVSFNTLTRRFTFRCSIPTMAIRFNKAISPAIGFPAEEWITPASHLFNQATSFFRPDVNCGMTSLFVYCNIVDPRAVGNSMVPLLRAVPIPTESKDENICKEFKHIHYIPAANGTHRTVTIDIRRDDGTSVLFEGGKVTVTLHLRKKT